MRRRHLLPVLLAVLLVFAQWVGAAHAAAHAPDHAPTHAHGKGVPVTACDECLAFATVEPAPGAAVAVFLPVPEVRHALADGARDAVTFALHLPFRSRAPPAAP